MKTYKVMDGNEACSYISYLFSELAGIYPITPASKMAEKVDELSSKGFNNLYGSPLEIVQMQSEKGAIVFINSGNRHITDVDYRVRLVDTSEYAIESLDEFYGALCGILSI